MSNPAVGAVYATIIDEVINSSRVDFEESGVEESVLEELRQGWQRKLTQLNVANFPWDPKPDPPPQAQQAPPAAPQVSAPPVHSQAQFSPQIPQGLPLPNVAQQQPQNGIKTEPGYVKTEGNMPIKQEPGLAQNSAPQYQGYNPLDNKNNVAAQRAAQQLQAQYGQRAAGSINALNQQQQPQSQPQQQPQQPQLPQPQQPQLPQQGMTQQQQQAYRQQMAQATQQQRAQAAANGQNHIHNGQTDGAGDDDGFEGVLLERGAAGDFRELGRIEIDRMLHDQIAAKAKSMEGGGLMLPLKEASKHSTAARSLSQSKGKQPAGYDGVDDDDDIDDEDAINSDLDDPDEDRDDDEVDDEGLGHIMLCMYDKVQRVKNKWKCTLKDGVLTVNGKEYVFHKATGEYEW